MSTEIDAIRSYRSDEAFLDAATLDRLRSKLNDELGPGASHHQRDRRPRRVAAFAMCAVLLAIVALLAWNGLRHPSGDGGGIADRSSAPLAPLIADGLPNGYRFAGATPVNPDTTARTTVYARSDATDPVHDDMVSVTTSITPGPEVEQPTSDEIASTIMRADDFASVLVPSGAYLHLFASRGVDDEQLLTAIEGLSIDGSGTPSIDAAALPDGWSELDLPPIPRPMGQSSYFGDGHSSETMNVMFVSWGRGTPADLELISLGYPQVVSCGGRCAPATLTAERTVLGGWPESIRVPGEGTVGIPVQLAWVEDGRLTTISSYGAPVGAMYVLAAALRESTWEEVEAALDRPVTTEPGGATSHD